MTLARCADGLGRLDTFLNIVDRFPEPLPTECTQTLAEVWQVLDSLLENYGHINELAEGSCAVIRRGLQFFGPTALSIAPSIVQRMTLSFERGGGPSYLWITGKVAWQFRGAGDEGLPQALGIAFERESAKVFAMLHASGPAAIPDGPSPLVHQKRS